MQMTATCGLEVGDMVKDKFDWVFGALPVFDSRGRGRG